jgi:hypothetical protein
MLFGLVLGLYPILRKFVSAGAAYLDACHVERKQTSARHASIRTLSGRQLGPVQVGVGSSPGPFGPGLLGLLSKRRSLRDQRVTRSHPNRAADVTLQKTPRSD